MPTYRYLLKAQDGSGEVRRGVSRSHPDKDTLEQSLLAREQKLTDFRVSPEQITTILKQGFLSEAEVAKVLERGTKRAGKFVPLPHRAHLNAHRQEKPYLIEKIEEVR